MESRFWGSIDRVEILGGDILSRVLFLRVDDVVSQSGLGLQEWIKSNICMFSYQVIFSFQIFK